MGESCGGCPVARALGCIGLWTVWKISVKLRVDGYVRLLFFPVLKWLPYHPERLHELEKFGEEFE